MIPVNAEKTRIKRELNKIIKTLDKKGYQNIQIADILGTIDVRVSQLRKGGENAKNFSLKALQPMLAKGQQFLETMEK